MSQLASGINRLAEVNAKRMKFVEKDREALLEFRKEETEKNRQHEKEIAQIYLRMIEMQRQPHPVAPYQHLQPAAFVMLFHPFPIDSITVRPHFVTMYSDFEQFLYVYSRFLEFDLKKNMDFTKERNLCLKK